jgi:hypothetical protein
MTKSDDSANKEEQLRIIMASIAKAQAKLEGKQLVTPRDYLTTKIADFLQISNAQAANYLKILDSRDLIKLDKNNVIYAPKGIQKQELDLDSYFEELGEKDGI